jgi:hypothetical protein
MTVVTPFTIAQPGSEPDNAVAGADKSGPAPCASDNAQIIIDTSVMNEMIFIMINSFFVLSGGVYSIGTVIRLYTIHPTNSEVVIFALSGRVFFMWWNEGNIASSMAVIHNPPVQDCTENLPRPRRIRCISVR